MDERQARHKLATIEQLPLLKYWDVLSPHEKSSLLAQINALDLPILKFQQQLLPSKATALDALEPFTHYAQVEDIPDIHIGKEMIAAGQLGCLIVAGGQGSRLGFEGPKGMFQVTPVKQKSLFQLFAEKVKAASKQAGRSLPLAIMTSPLNHADTVAYFEKHRLFDLNPDQLSIFSQDMLPLLNTQGSLFLQNKHTLALGPDGNGGALHHFYKQGIWDKWHRQGVRYLNFTLIDNALCDPYDAALLTYQAQQQSDVVVKCTKRHHPEEKVGILAQRDHKAVIVEYSEMPSSQRQAINADGSLLYPCANLSLFCFRMNFVKKVAHLPVDALPLHLAFKATNSLDSTGKTTQTNAWKFEKFIFDVLPFANHVSALLYPRQDCFAPLKNSQGEDSIDTVKMALQEYDRKIFSQIIGYPCTNTPFELAQEFHYPTHALLSKWRNQRGPYENYIEA